MKQMMLPSQMRSATTAKTGSKGYQRKTNVRKASLMITALKVRSVEKTTKMRRMDKSH